jgi:hypothetical protein
MEIQAEGVEVCEKPTKATRSPTGGKAMRDRHDKLSG